MNVLAILPGLIPSTIIGITKPLERLAVKGEISLRVKTTRYATKVDIAAADVVVFCRNCDYQDLEFLYEAKRAGKYVIYDIDDNFFAIPTHSALGIIHRWSPRLFIVTEFFRLSDYVRTYSQPVYDEAVKYNDNVDVVKSYFDFSLIDNVTVAPRPAGSPTRICYQTSRGPYDTMMRMFLKPLDKVIFEGHGSIEFHFWGKEYPPLSNRDAVRLHSFERNYDKFVADCYRSQFDIGLAPTETDLFSQSKTNNKYREYGAMGVAGVYTRMPVYEACIEDGVNGLLVENTEGAWREAIERLLHDTALRQRIVENARADVRENYSSESAVEVWSQALKGADRPRYGAVPPEPQEDKMNVLVFFDEAAHLEEWIQPIGEVCGFMQANLSVKPLSDFGALNAQPNDAVIIVGARPHELGTAAWGVKHGPKKLFLVLVNRARKVQPPEFPEVKEAGVKTALKSKLKPQATLPARAKGSAVVKQSPPTEFAREMAELDELCVLMGHVTIVTNDPTLAKGMKTPVRVIEDPSPIRDVKGDGAARFWIEALSQTPIRRRDRRLQLRLSHHFLALGERMALMKLNNRRPFSR
jgi:hypothetical protein